MTEAEAFNAYQLHTRRCTGSPRCAPTTGHLCAEGGQLHDQWRALAGGEVRADRRQRRAAAAAAREAAGR